MFKSFGFDSAFEYHTKVHQIRVVSTPDVHGVSVVEGPHRDGQDWQIVAVFNRHNITGGQSQFLPSGGGRPFFTQTVKSGYAICNEDAKMWHNATDIKYVDDQILGHRDIFIVATNRWTHRKYGDEFETASLIDGTSDWKNEKPEESPETSVELEYVALN